MRPLPASGCVGGGAQVYDTSAHQRIFSIRKPASAAAAPHARPHLYWEADSLLYVGWASTVTVPPPPPPPPFRGPWVGPALPWSSGRRPGHHKHRNTTAHLSGGCWHLLSDLLHASEQK